MKKYLFSAIAAALFCGCVPSTPPLDVVPVVSPLNQATLEIQQQREKEFRTLLETLPDAGVWLYPKAFSGHYDAALIIDRVRKLGFRRIYAMVTSEDDLDSHFVSFAEKCAEEKIPFHVVLRQSIFFPRPRGNAFTRCFTASTPNTPEMVQKIVDLNDRTPIAGVVIVFEPHLFHKRGEYFDGMLYEWSDTSFGPGLDNDVLVRMSFDMLRKLPELPEGMRLEIALEDFYQALADDGKISLGKVSDFQNLRSPAPNVLIVNSGNKATELTEKIRRQLAETARPHSISLCAQLAGHTSTAKGFLRRRDWKDLTRTLSYIVRECNQYPSFNGIVIGPLIHIESMRAEKD